MAHFSEGVVKGVYLSIAFFGIRQLDSILGMDQLPSSIEAYLEEAGFSPTEIILLKRLLEDDALTLRQLAMKTGKSTGVLDQAMKKLLKKGIVSKEAVNGQPAYTIHSLDTIAQWMERDTKEKQQMLERRHHNFESFISSLSIDKSRPELEHFEGEEGIKTAYKSLLLKGQDLLAYLPTTYKEEEDPLREFRVQWFRERRSRGIFLRVITHDTPLGRRYQSRDAFEYRKTILVPDGTCPMSFEQYMIGHTYACIDHSEQKACFIHFAHLVDAERAFFETLWENPKREITIHELEQRGQGIVTANVSLKTRIFSALREFFLSRKSLAALGVIALLAAALTIGMYRYTQRISMDRIKEQVKTVAATGASQFNPDDLAQLQVEADWQKPQWAKVVNQLRDMRVNNENMHFVYMFRKSLVRPGKIDFVADSHSLNPYANVDNDPTNDVDTNGNGVIEKDGADFLQWPGQSYDSAPKEAFAALETDHVTVTENFYTDSWGTMVSGYAPIRDKDNHIVAVLAADMDVSKLGEFTGKIFQPLVFFALFFFAFVLIRFAAANRSLAMEFWTVLQTRRSVARIGLLIVVLIGAIYGLYVYEYIETRNELGERLKSVAATAVADFKAEDIAQVHKEEDMNTEVYQRLFKHLNDIRNKNPGVKFAYIMRPTQDANTFEFVADADSNYALPYYVQDFNRDGVLDNADVQAPPGTPYDVTSSSPQWAIEALRKPTYVEDLTDDQWGSFLTGSAPIYDASGKAIAVLGLDIDVSDLREMVWRKIWGMVGF